MVWNLESGIDKGRCDEYIAEYYSKNQTVLVCEQCKTFLMDNDPNDELIKIIFD